MAILSISGSKPKLKITLGNLGGKHIADRDLEFSLEIYMTKNPEQKITLAKSDLTPITGEEDSFYYVLDTTQLGVGSVNVRTTIAFTDPDTGKEVKEISVQSSVLNITK